MRVVSRRAWLFGAALLAMAAASGVARADDPAAAAPIEALDQALLAAMKAGASAPFTERYNLIAPAVDGAFDLRGVLVASVGPRFSTLPAAQQSQLLDVFRKFTIASYASNFDGYAGQKLEVLPKQRTAGADVIVATQIVPERDKPTEIDYVMRQTPQGWRAVDVLLDGSISQNAVKRSDFRSLITPTSAQRLIDSLKQKVSQLSGGAVS